MVSFKCSYMINWDIYYDSQLLLIVDMNNSSLDNVTTTVVCLSTNEILLQCDAVGWHQDMYVALVHHLYGSFKVWHFDRMLKVGWLKEKSLFMMHMCMQMFVFDLIQPYALNRCMCLVVHLCVHYRCASWLQGFLTVWVQLLSFPALLFL